MKRATIAVLALTGLGAGAAAAASATTPFGATQQRVGPPPLPAPHS